MGHPDPLRLAIGVVVVVLAAVAVGGIALTVEDELARSRCRRDGGHVVTARTDDHLDWSCARPAGERVP